MSNVSTFGAFSTARLGMYASQRALEIVGNNIANINTEGYTRQALEQRSMYIGGADRYTSISNLRIGGGVRCIGVSQIRDPYLDIRYQIEILNLVQKLNREFGITIVMVLHDINQAIHFSDQIIGLAAGKVLVKGAPGNVISAECIQKLYGIELGVTEIDGKKFVLTV